MKKNRKTRRKLDQCKSQHYDAIRAHVYVCIHVCKTRLFEVKSCIRITPSARKKPRVKLERSEFYSIRDTQGKRIFLQESNWIGAEAEVSHICAFDVAWDPMSESRRSTFAF
jgi:hypothetical protein